MNAGMNVIFRRKLLKERQREQEEAAPAEEVFSSQATRCAKRETDTENRREREGERERARKRLQQLRGLEREGTAQVRDGRERREKQWKARVQRLLLQKAPCYVSRLHSHESHKTAERRKNQQCSAGV